MFSQPPLHRAPSSLPWPWQVAAGLSPQAHLGCRRAAQTWGLGNGGGGQQPRSWAPESKGLEVSPKTLQPATVSSPSPSSLPAWGACQHPSLPFPQLPSCSECSSCLPTPTPEGLSAPSQQFHLWNTLDELAPTPLHMHVTVLDCRISPPACPPPSVTPHTSLLPLHLLAEISVLLNRCPYLFQKDSSMLFFSKGKKKGKKKQCQQPSVREQPNSNKAGVRDGGR